MAYFILSPTRTPLTQDLFTFFAKSGVKAQLFGSYLINSTIFGTPDGANDMDWRIPINDWRELPRAFRSAFELTVAHQRYLEHCFGGGNMPQKDPLMVYRLRKTATAEDVPESLLHATIPIEISLIKEWIPAQKMAATGDIGITQIVDDGEKVWVTPNFDHDAETRHLTIRRVNDCYDLLRTNRRLTKMIGGRFEGWQAILPEEFAHYHPRHTP